MDYISRMKREIFRDIPGYEGLYQASNLGRIKSLNFRKSPGGRILKQALDGNGYPRVMIKSKNKKVHKIIALTFLNHDSQGRKFVIDHINGDKTDNSVYNLRIVSFRENTSKERTIKSGLPVGVYYSKEQKRFHSKIFINGKAKHLGSFMNSEEASAAYQQALNNIK